MNKEDFFKLIKDHIERDSFHITIVKSDDCPRFAYSIGNLENLGFELILAGNENYLYDDVLSIFNNLVPYLNKELNWKDLKVELPNLGAFRLSPVHDSWSKKMMLGVYDYYNIKDFIAYQILPDNLNRTLDIPDMSKNWSADNTIWKWLDDTIKWDLNVPKDSQVITEVKVLLGEKVKEVTRWEVNEWEAFTQNGENVDKENIRIVSISTLLGIDKSLEPILKLDIEEGLWRKDENSEWNDWS